MTHEPAASLQLPRATLASMVTERIRDSIVTGALEPGSQLSEVELARSFGVSRGPVREDIQRHRLGQPQEQDDPVAPHPEVLECRQE